MRRLRLLLLIALPCAAHAQTATTGVGARPSPIEAAEVLWSTSDYNLNSARGFIGRRPTVTDPRSPYVGTQVVPDTMRLRHMSVVLKNTSDAPVESVRLAFVFSDPSSGEEWFRYKARIKGRMLPGESVVVEKFATATFGFPPRDMVAKKTAVVTEVKFADGSVWRRK
jgi:hypothetical protein